MKPAKASLLYHPLFLFSLVLLFLNDAIGKPVFHNAITGKLSDLTGLVVLAVFLRVLFPRKRVTVTLFTAFAFTWWKLDASQPFIDWLEVNWRLRFERVVDPTDLWALLVLPVALRLQPAMPPAISARILRPALLVITMVVLVADTPPHYLHRPEGTTYTGKKIRLRWTEQEILNRIRETGLQPQRDTGWIDERGYWNDTYLLHSDSNRTEWVALKDHPNYKLYTKYEYHDPTYLLQRVILGRDTVNEVRFQLAERKPGILFRLHSFRLRPEQQADDREARKTARRFGRELKNHFENLLRN